MMKPHFEGKTTNTNPMYSRKLIHPRLHNNTLNVHSSCIVKHSACGGEILPNVWFVASQYKSVVLWLSKVHPYTLENHSTIITYSIVSYNYQHSYRYWEVDSPRSIRNQSSPEHIPCALFSHCSIAQPALKALQFIQSCSCIHFMTWPPLSASRSSMHTSAHGVGVVS